MLTSPVALVVSSTATSSGDSGSGSDALCGAPYCTFVHERPLSTKTAPPVARYCAFSNERGVGSGMRTSNCSPRRYFLTGSPGVKGYGWGGVEVGGGGDVGWGGRDRLKTSCPTTRITLSTLTRLCSIWTCVPGVVRALVWESIIASRPTQSHLLDSSRRGGDQSGWAPTP